MAGKSRNVVTLTVVLAAALMLTACGGEKTGSDSTTALPKTTSQAVSTIAASRTEASAPDTTAAAQLPTASASTGELAGDDGSRTAVTLKSEPSPGKICLV